MGGAAGFAAVILALVVVTVFAALAGFSVSKATRGGGKTYFKVRAAGVVLEFGSEINGSSTQGVRSADAGALREHGELEAGEQGQLKIVNAEVVEPPPVELPPGRRSKWRWPRKRAPSGGEA